MRTRYGRFSTRVLTKAQWELRLWLDERAGDAQRAVVPNPPRLPQPRRAEARLADYRAAARPRMSILHDLSAALLASPDRKRWCDVFGRCAGGYPVWLLYGASVRGARRSCYGPRCCILIPETAVASEHSRCPSHTGKEWSYEHDPGPRAGP